MPVSIVLHIWDLLLLSSDNAAPLYFACAIVMSQRSSVLTGDPDALPLLLRNCLQHACVTCQSVNDVWLLTENLMISTPQSFKSVLHKVTHACMLFTLAFHAHPPPHLTSHLHTAQALTSATLNHHVRLLFCPSPPCSVQ